MMGVIMPSVIMLCGVMFTVIMLSVIMLCAVTLTVVMLSVIMLCVVMLSVVAPKNCLDKANMNKKTSIGSVKMNLLENGIQQDILL
jgi:hypothetical protein